MEVVAEELSGEHRLFGIGTVTRLFVTAFFYKKGNFHLTEKFSIKIHILNMKVQLQIN